EGALRVAPVPQLSDLTTYVIPSSGLAFIILSASAAVSGLGGGGGVGTLSSSVLIASATTFGSTPCALATSASVLPPCCSCLSWSGVIPSADAAAASGPPSRPSTRRTKTLFVAFAAGVRTALPASAGRPGGRPASFDASAIAPSSLSRPTPSLSARLLRNLSWAAFASSEL